MNKEGKNIIGVSFSHSAREKKFAKIEKYNDEVKKKKKQGKRFLLVEDKNID